MKKSNMKGFTLVELLAVIVILAIILVIAVPKVMSVIEDAKKATLESTAKMIASQAEKQKVQNTVLGNEENIICKNITNINDVDYASCDITFDNNTAKVTIIGGGKFEGLYVCNGTKTNATAQEERCLKKVSLTVDLDEGIDSVDYEIMYLEGSEVTLTEPTKEGFVFNGWTVTGTGAKVEGNKLIIGTENTTVTATWKEKVNAVSFEENDWGTIVAAVRQAETNGTEYPYSVGNEKTIEMDIDGNGSAGQYTIRVANTTPCDGTLASETACGFVLEFADIITTYNMNPAGEYNGTQYDYGTNLGGWPASAMRTYVNGEIYNAIPEELRTGIIDTTVVSSHGSTTGEENFTSTDKLYLLSTREVWGKEGTSNTIDYDTADGDTITRQLDYYANNNVSTTNYSGAIKYNGSTASYWWLRSAYSYFSTTFYDVGYDGSWNYGIANLSVGVAPAFRIG